MRISEEIAVWFLKFKKTEEKHHRGAKNEAGKVWYNLTEPTARVASVSLTDLAFSLTQSSTWSFVVEN